MDDTYERMLCHSLTDFPAKKPDVAYFLQPEQHRADHPENITNYAPFIRFDPPGGIPTQDSDEAVPLHLACPSCERMVYGILEQVGDTQEFWSRKLSLSQHTIGSLKESSKKGCHLCSLVLGDSGLSHKGADSVSPDALCDSTFPFKPGMPLASQDVKIFTSELRFQVIRPRDLMLDQIFHRSIPKVLSPSHFASLARLWTSACAHQHQGCSVGPCLEHERPTRLIDISDPHVLVLVTKENLQIIKEIEYVTLSYRWGKGSFLKLNSDSLDLLKAGIPYNLVAQVFQDAILLTRSINYKYIWIDALCILQDSVQDWACESNRMADVYRNGALNICISNTGPNETCLRNRNPLSWYHCLIAENDDEVVVASTTTKPNINNKDVLKRGWVFQERLLSPRKIYIGEEDCVFECTNSIVRERAPCWWEWPRAGVSKSNFHNMIKSAVAVHSCDSMKDRYPDLEFFHRDIDYNFLCEQWQNLVQAYVRTSLTFSTDRLPALAAIATSLRNATGFNYLAGHWYELLPLGLLWYQDFPSSSVLRLVSPRKRFPSWAWISAELEERYSILHQHRDCSEDTDNCAKMLGFQVTELKGRTAVLGEVESARLQIAGIVTPITRWNMTGKKGKDFFSVEFQNGQILRTQQEKRRSHFAIEKVELEEGLDPRVSLTFLTISTQLEIGGDGRCRVGLLLAPYNDGFTRVGLMSLVLKRWLSNDRTPVKDPLKDIEVEQVVYIY